MTPITDHATFTSESVKFIANAKAAWEHATLLAVSAINHYYESDKKDYSWVVQLFNSFLECDGKFDACFQAFVKDATNIKFRQDKDNLAAPVTGTTKGSYPHNYAEIISHCENKGLQKYAGAAKNKSRVDLWNNDFEKAAKKESTKADVVSLSLTKLGGSLVDTAKAAEDLTPEQQAVAMEAAHLMEQIVKGLKSGISPDKMSGVITTFNTQLDAMAKKALASLAQAKPSEGSADSEAA